jgi:hypothetical protein
MGDKALSYCAYPELNDDICCTSVESCKLKANSCQSSTFYNTSEQSLSPMPGNNMQAKKISAVKATEEAVDAIAS